MSNNETTSCSQSPLPQLASLKSESAAPVENSNEQEKHSPPVPIKTYEWEELRRAKEKGGYPWTYLRESQYDKLRDSDEDIKPQLDAMEAQTSDDGANLSEILTPVDHSKSAEDVSIPEDKPSLPVDPSNAVIIIPIDHTIIEATEDHIYEPIQRHTSVEIHLNDLPIVTNQIVPSSIIEPIDETKKDGKTETEPPVASSSKTIDENEVASEDKVPEMVVKRPPLLSRKLESQSMSVDEERTYLDKHILKSTSLDEDYNKWSKLNDHEYEPISAPSQVVGETIPSSGFSDKASIAHIDEVDVDDDVSSTTSAERRYLRIPLDDELVVPDDGNLEDEAMKSEAVSMDERYLNATPTTTISRTDCELNTSQVDSSALEDLPLHRGSRKKATLAVAENTKTQNFQERMRSSAGKIKSKLKGIRKPKERKTPEVKPERAKSEKKSFFERAKNIERPKFSMPKMPERPKISMPKMPERPKISMPKMPERPKINMPKMPDRPKINMPKMPDISMPKMPDISMPKMPEINFPSLGRNKASASKVEEPMPKSESTTTDESSAQNKRRKFEFDFRTYPKILNRTKKAKTVVHDIPKTGEKSQKAAFFALAPDWVTMPRKNRKKTSTGKSLPKKPESPARKNFPRQGSMQTNYDVTETPDVQIIRLRDYSLDEDQNMSENEQEPLPYDNEVEEILKNSAMDQTTAFEEINLKSDMTPQIYHQDPEEIRNSLKAISGESLPERPRDHESIHEDDRGYASSERGGVIEEINADEFFVREKGISQDNIDVSRYLSSEIREAFQTPVNVLSQMAEVDRPYYDYDNHFDDYYRRTEDSPVIPQTPPPRTLRKKKGKKSTSEEKAIEKKEQEKVEENNLINKEKDLENEQIIENIITYDRDSYKTFPPKRPSRSRSKTSLSSKKTLPEGEDDAAYEKPIAPYRRKRSLTSSKSLNASDYALQKIPQNVSLQEIRYHEYQQPRDIKPVAPKRKLRPSQSQSTVHTINDDDRTSHGADSIVSEDRIVNEVPQPKEVPEIPGYAKVDKSHSHPPIAVEPPPPRTKKKKKSKDTQFFTVPRRLRDAPPERPKRTYSTLQSRKSRERSIPIVSAPDKENYIQDTQYIEIEDDDGIARNLQSGEVIEKMKGRPLPAPPRPPRKTRDTILQELPIQDNRLLSAEDKNDGHKSSNESIVKGMLFLGNQVNIVTEITPGVHTDDDNFEEVPSIEAEEAFKIVQQNSFSDEEIIEVEMSTQTDPLPEDFCCEEVITEPTDIILAPTRRRRISQDINQNIPVVVADMPLEEFHQAYLTESHSATLPEVEPEDSISLQGRRGILEQQSQERYSESPICHDDEMNDSFVRLTRSQQSTLISRPVAETDSTTQNISSEPVAVALPETLRVERLQVSDLDVDRLTVSELLAQKILVSEIDGMSLKVNDVSSTSGSLTTDDIRLPPGFIESIIEKIQASRTDDSETSISEPKTVIEKHITYVKESSTNTDEPLPSTSQEGENIAVSVPNVTLPPTTNYPYPHIFVLPSTFQMPEPVPSTSTGGVTPTGTPTPAPDAPSSEAPDPSIPDLSVQLLRACHSSIKRTVRQVILEVSSQLNSGDEKRDARTAVVIIVILIAGLILLGMTSRGDTVHHHHWEYFNPPNGDRPV